MDVRLAGAMEQPLKEEERKARAALALAWLKRLAVGEVPGFDVRPAQGAILSALRNEALARLAIEAAGRLPGKDPQRALAEIVLTSPKAELRAQAANELAHHILQHGLALPASQVKGLQDLLDATKEPRLRASIAQVLGSFRPSATVSGDRLKDYVPPTETRPVPPEKEK
jgi:hypothetical protein